MSWRSAYRGILADRTLGPGLDAERLAHWSVKLAGLQPRDVVLLIDGEGFIAVWDRPGDAHGAYIDNLHIHPERRGDGLGRRLLGTAMRRLAAQDERRAHLHVFEANRRALAFYQRLGGEVIGRQEIEIDGHPAPELLVAWTDTAALATACGVP